MLVKVAEGSDGGGRTGLEGAGSLVAETGDRLGGLVEGGLLGVGGDLLLGLLAETLATASC